ncbi:EamA family transporter [Hymenobacter sp. BT18]|uniref:EamA family transporter n=1 Tax=Hymenobacter sp. BT18 TaxID=2835648 RepID=UPI00143EF453|nr:EamA family transporter [Hymenobacter sp. BT18]QIX63117.1 EamA family transporter [Hymenobacter sp. BT18]
MWWFYALLSAVFAALTAILAKVGVKNVDSNLATALRTVVILVLAWGVVCFRGGLTQVQHLSRTTLLFLGLSGLATGLSWLFYFKALQLGTVTQVAPVDKLSVALTILLAVVFLGEKLTWQTGLGAGFILLGTLILVWR